MGLIQDIVNEEIRKLYEEREHFTKVYHGTSYSGAQDIMRNGIDMNKSEGGYFGKGFYCALDFNLAKNNYAEFAEEEGIDERGVVLEFDVNPGANILDLRDERDWEIYKPIDSFVKRPNSFILFQQHGIDGLYDNSFEGVVFYNPKAITLVQAHKI